MVETLHIVATCTARKRVAVAVADVRRLREIDDGSPWIRAARWWARLRAGPTVASTRARDLYAGEHWSTVLALPTVPALARFACHPWVASAGYGLVGWDASLVPYSATFAAGFADSVLGRREGGSHAPRLREWWNALSAYAGPDPGAPRRIAALAASDPEGAIVVVASPDYVRAMQADLLEARALLVDPTRLVVISNRAKLMGGLLHDHLVPVDRRATAVVGGSLHGLNARVALGVLRRLGPARLDVGRLREIYAAMVRAPAHASHRDLLAPP